MGVVILCSPYSIARKGTAANKRGGRRSSNLTRFEGCLVVERAGMSSQGRNKIAIIVDRVTSNATAIGIRSGIFGRFHSGRKKRNRPLDISPGCGETVIQRVKAPAVESAFERMRTGHRLCLSDAVEGGRYG